MIIVDDVTPTLDVLELVQWLLRHPVVVSRTERFKAMPTVSVTASYSSVYVCQKEFATASSGRAKYIGTDEATTCVGLAIRNPVTGLTSVGHFDDVKCISEGLLQMLTSLGPSQGTRLEVHMVGAFDDSLDSDYNEETQVGNIQRGHSWPICLCLIEALHTSAFTLEIKTACILKHNTALQPSGYSVPIVRGFLVELASGFCMPAEFSDTSRGPDLVVRGLALSLATNPPYSRFRLSNPYDTFSDTFSIAPFKWNREWKALAAELLRMTDAEMLATCSTSPHAESSQFLPYIRRLHNYIYNHPDWRDTFPNNRARRHSRSATGEWVTDVCLATN